MTEKRHLVLKNIVNHIIFQSETNIGFILIITFSVYLTYIKASHLDVLTHAWKHLHDRIISMRWVYWVHEKTSLSPSLLCFLY